MTEMSVPEMPGRRANWHCPDAEPVAIKQANSRPRGMGDVVTCAAGGSEAW